MTVKVEDIEYIKVGGYSNVPVIRVDEVNEFLKLVDKFKANQIFLTKKKYSRRNEDETEIEITDAPTYDKDEECVVLTQFLLYHDGAMYVLLGFNYNTIYELIKGRSVGFKYGDWYYEAMKSGFADYQEYEKAKDLGYQTKADFVEGEKRGFIECYKRLTDDEYYYLRRRYVHEDRDQFFYDFRELKRSPKYDVQIFHLAKKLGYESFEEFRKGLSKGFESGDQYRQAISRGFDAGKQFREANERGIATREQYDKYLELEDIRTRYDLETIEEAHVFSILLIPEIGRNVPITKLWKNLREEQGGLKINNVSPGQPTDWYTKTFREINGLKAFLSKNKSVEKIGTYNKDNDILMINLPDRLAYEIAVVDGSNVAWNAGSKERGDKPVARNIRLMVETLKKRGFEKIIVIADASLYGVEDREALYELEKESILNKAPSREEADRFIIEYAKERDPLIITNDTFKDWKEKDPWVDKNIEKHLVKFMIVDNVVTFGEYRYDEKIDKRLRSVKSASATPVYDDEADYDIDD